MFVRTTYYRIFQCQTRDFFVQVGIDGWIAFGRSIEDAEPEIFPTTSANTFWTYIVAPFWGDLSTVDGGMVSWEIHNASLSPGVFNRVNAFIRNEFGDSNFDGTWMIICFWEDVLASETLSVGSHHHTETL